MSSPIVNFIEYMEYSYFYLVIAELKHKSKKYCLKSANKHFVQFAIRCRDSAEVIRLADNQQ